MNPSASITTTTIAKFSCIYDGYNILAHSRATALRGKFCCDKSSQNLNPLEYYIRHLDRQFANNVGYNTTRKDSVSVNEI
jgi:hypothetical protein